MSGLIEGLPDAIAIRCLARVPFYLHPKLEVVSRSWQAAIHSPELFKARQEVGSSEELLCVCASYADKLWHLYDPLRDLWMTLPVLPSTIMHLLNYGVVSTAGKLFVIGGGSDGFVNDLTGILDGFYATNEVWSYDPVVRQWGRRASMLVPRYKFACCVVNGKIVVAGGFTNYGKSISKAEMYDPEKDVWIPMPDLHRTYKTACSGVMIGGKMHVVHENKPVLEVLDSAGAGWIVEECGWRLQSPMAVVQDALYVMSAGSNVVYKQEKDGRKVAVSASKFGRRYGFAMIGLGDELYVIGGLPLLRDVTKLLSVVDVLSVGNERPTWRQATPMTGSRACGRIYGSTLLRI